VKRQGYEGLVAKDESSAYRGGRTLSWIKVWNEERVVGRRRWLVTCPLGELQVRGPRGDLGHR
jgi:hypothetical protein